MPGDCIKSIIQTEFALASNINELPSGSFCVTAKRVYIENNRMLPKRSGQIVIKIDIFYDGFII